MLYRHPPAAAGIVLAAPGVADDRFFRELAVAKLQHLAVLRLAESRRHGLREVLLSERLSQGWPLRVEARGKLGKSRSQNYRQMRPVFPNLLDELEARHSRHGVIGKHEFNGVLAPQNIEGLGRGGSFEHLVSEG